jgi:alpha-glucoside transport system permease protein
VSSTTVEAPPKAQAQPPEGDQLEAAGRGGWFVRITIVVIVILWTIPTLGVLITSLRPEDAVNASGWWTVFAHPFRATEWTIENYRIALDQAASGTRS